MTRFLAVERKKIDRSPSTTISSNNDVLRMHNLQNEGDFFGVFQASGGKREASTECESPLACLHPPAKREKITLVLNRFLAVDSFPVGWLVPGCIRFCALLAVERKLGREQKKKTVPISNFCMNIAYDNLFEKLEL